MLKCKLPLGLFSLAVVGLTSSLMMIAQADSGTASATMTLVVPVKTVVTCSSPSVTAASGVNALVVTCNINGNPNNLAAGSSNNFGPSDVTLSSSGGDKLKANLQPGITSPDSTVASISGTSAGFSGVIKSLPAKVQAIYNVSTDAATKSGTYTGSTTYTWSTL
jgi:hypothetical protein